MENNAKKKVTVRVAGAQLTLLTDESESFVDAVADRVNERMAGLTKNSFRVNRTDAALLCAVDFCGDLLKAEKKVMNLEAQISLYNMNFKRLREEIIVLKQQAGIPLDDNDVAFAKELEEERYEAYPEDLGTTILSNEEFAAVQDDGNDAETIEEYELGEEDTATDAPTDEETAASETDGDAEYEPKLDMDKLSDMLRTAGDDAPEQKIRTLEKYLENRKKGEAEGQSRDDKIKYIESLLRGN